MRRDGTDVLATATAFRDALVRVVAGLLSAPADRDDVVQETILRLMESDLASIRNVEAWMTTVARRLAVDRVRARRARGGDVVATAVVEDDAIAGRDRRLLSSCLFAHLDHLDEDERRLLEADSEGRPREQLAEERGLTVKGLNSRIRRARERLRGLFAACCRTEFDEGGAPIGLVRLRVGDGNCGCRCGDRT